MPIDERESMRRHLTSILTFVIALSVGLMMIFFFYPYKRVVAGQGDFVGLYLGGTLAGTPELYTSAPQYEAQKKLFGGSVMKAVLFSRPPFYAWLLKPLSMLPFPTAYLLFQAASLGVFLWFLWWSRHRYKEILLLGPMFPPVVAVFCNGQDVGIAMGLALGSFLAARAGKDLLSGLILSLCAIKLHLFVLLPLAVLLNRRYRIFLGGLIGGAVLAGLSLLGGGTAVIASYVALLRNPVIHPSVDAMPNVKGIAYALNAGSSLEIILSILIVVTAGWMMWKSKDYELSFAYALVGGLLVNVHCYMADCMLILLALVIVAEKKSMPKLAFSMLVFAATPIPAVALQNGAPASLLLPALLIGTLVVTAVRPNFQMVPVRQPATSEP